jgi:hypothetical protein
VYQNASRKEKLRNEIAQERRENAAFVLNSESKMIENMQRKRQWKEGESTQKKESTRIRRHFQQKEVVNGTKPEKRSSIPDKVFE